MNISSSTYHKYNIGFVLNVTLGNEHEIYTLVRVLMFNVSDSFCRIHDVIIFVYV
jgi:ACT domain-containing protein